jgi:hypothetical protein
VSLSSEQKCLTTLTAAVAFVLFIIATFAKLSLGKGKALFVSDGFYYYAYTVSLVLDRDLDFSNQYQFNKGWASFTYAYIVPQTGYPANQYGIGFGLLLLPAFAIAHLGVLAAKAVGLPLTTNGYELYYQLPTYLWSFLLGLLGMGLLYRLLTEVFDWHYAFGAAVGILFGTALSNYAFLHANMSHWVSAASATGRLVMAIGSARAVANLGSRGNYPNRCRYRHLPAPNRCLANHLWRIVYQPLRQLCPLVFT